MNNRTKYKNVFMNYFSVKEEALETLEYQGIKKWDSVGHMGLIALLENEFDIMFETNDILNFSSYKKGLELLEKYGLDL